MSTLAPSNVSLIRVSPAILHRFSVDEYHQMIQAGVFGEDDPVELLEGWIVDKMPRTPPHDATIDVAVEVIGTALPREWRVRNQSGITLAESEPEPDLAVVLGPARRYTNNHPRPADIALIVEVAGSSLDHDRDVKGPIYAAAGIPVYWIVNLEEAAIEAYSNPTSAGYATRDDFALGTTVPLIIAGQLVCPISVQDLLA